MSEFKIDIVYLWCNIDDPEFKKRKLAYANGLTLAPEANDNCRYTDNGELKHSLRSLSKYAPWINKIFIVTDNQIPEWLNTDNEKIRVINQNDILPEDAKPCFNSIAIEHSLMNIRELSEYYLYANDDMFFNDYVTPNFFFDKKGRPICRFRKKRKSNVGLYNKVLKNAEQLVYKKYGVMVDNEPHHNIDSYRKSEVIKCREIFREELDKNVLSHFRSPENYERAIYLKYFCATKTGKFKKVSRVDSDLPIFIRLFNLITKKYVKDSCLIFPNGRNIEKILDKFNPKLFCINDSEEATEDDRQYIKDFLKGRFPEKSEFEL